MSPRRTRSFFLVALLGLALAACGSSGDDGSSEAGPEPSVAPGDGPRVAVRSAEFEPAAVKIAAGDTVTWAFEDRALSHNVVGDSFKSPLKKSGTYRHTFAEPGTFEYRCTLHPTMKGKVEVAA